MKVLFVIPALPVAAGVLTLFIKLRFGLIKDGTKRMDTLCKWFADY